MRSKLLENLVKNLFAKFTVFFALISRLNKTKTTVLKKFDLIWFNLAFLEHETEYENEVNSSPNDDDKSMKYFEKKRRIMKKL